MAVDSLLRADSLLPQSRSFTDTLEMYFDDGDISAPISYRASDSLTYDLGTNSIYLFGNASMDYERINLQAQEVSYDWDQGSMRARGKQDSLGRYIGSPVFTEGTTSFTADSLLYPFKTRKGVIYRAVTQEGEGFLHASKVKQQDDDVYFGYNSKYTSCSLRDPHFHFGFRKSKVIPDKVIVTGPVNLRIADLPSPIVLPFAMFPAKQGRRSGVVFPQIGQGTRGFFLQDGGYYFAKSETYAMTFLGSIFTRGDFGLKFITDYNVRYKHNGNLYVDYYRRSPDNPELPNSGPANNDFKIRWTHQQDMRRHPTFRFSGNLTASTSTYRVNSANVNESALQTKFTSSISLTKTFKRTIFNSLVINLGYDQDLKTRLINLRLPEVQLSATTFYPFKPTRKPRKGKWYEQIGMNYNFSARNLISAVDSNFFSRQTLDQMRYGAQHTYSVNAPFKLFRYLNLTVSGNYNERWYSRRTRQTWDSDTVVNATASGDTFVYDTTFGQIITDTLGGFNRVYDFGASVQLLTKITGIYRFRSRRIQALRHIMTPSVSMSFRPNFLDERWGYWREVQSNADGSTSRYSPFAINSGLYGVPANALQATMGFNLQNSFDIKVQGKDTASEAKKIKLLDYNISTNYNFAADSVGLGIINMNGISNVLPGIRFNFGINLDVYNIDSSRGRTAETVWQANKRLFRLSSANMAFSTSLNPKAKTQQRLQDIQDNTSLTQEQKDYVIYNLDQFYDFSIPWNVNLRYTMTFTRGTVGDPAATVMNQNVSVNGNFSLTPKWKVEASTYLDITRKEFTSFNIGVVRDLHCWQLSFEWAPYPSNLQQFNIQLNVKSSELQELKLAKRSAGYQNAGNSFSRLGF